MLALSPVGKVNFDHFTPFGKFRVQGNVPGNVEKAGCATGATPGDEKEDAPRSD